MIDCPRCGERFAFDDGRCVVCGMRKNDHGPAPIRSFRGIFYRPDEPTPRRRIVPGRLPATRPQETGNNMSSSDRGQEVEPNVTVPDIVESVTPPTGHYGSPYEATLEQIDAGWRTGVIFGLPSGTTYEVTEQIRQELTDCFPGDVTFAVGIGLQSVAFYYRPDEPTDSEDDYYRRPDTLTDEDEAGDPATVPADVLADARAEADANEDTEDVSRYARPTRPPNPVRPERLDDGKVS